MASNGVTIRTLKDDLIDHLACVIECNMRQGKAFEPALSEALQELAPGGLSEIQRETMLLINYKKIIMKKVMYFLEMVAMICLTMGLMMKLMHFRGGEQLLNYGFLGFCFISFPMFMIHYFKTRSALTTTEKLKFGFGVLSAALTVTTVIFKLNMNLEESGISFMIAASIFSFGFLPLHFYGLYKKSVQAV